MGCENFDDELQALFILIGSYNRVLSELKTEYCPSPLKYSSDLSVLTLCDVMRYRPISIRVNHS